MRTIAVRSGLRSRSGRRTDEGEGDQGGSPNGRRRGNRRRAPLCVSLLAALAAVCAPAAFAQTTQPTKPEEIGRLVKQIAAPSYRAREQVLRRIAEVGPSAIPYLRREMNNPKQEIALAARELAEELEEVFFSGAVVRLEADPPRVRWDQPLRLRVIVENRAGFPTKIPWTCGAGSATRPARPAEQAALALDVSDFLEVTAPDDGPVELRVDPIGDDREVETAVEKRAKGGGATSPLAPGRTCTADVPEFNRGWARYPLLAKGRYRLRFTYQPEWTREEWIEAGLGKVVSEAIEVEVVEPAPPAVREAEASAAVSVTRDGGHLVARLQNTWDRPLCVNLNFRADTERFAQMFWMVVSDDGEPARVSLPPTAPMETPEPDANRIRLLRPAEEVELGRVEVAALLAAAAKERPRPAAGALQVSARYVAQGTRETLRKIGEKGRTPAHQALREWAEKNPYMLLTGAPQSPPVPLDGEQASTAPTSR